ncbi:hypothetical protein X777_11614 [Ooceraea biroi]|uniref:Uncharacterized protein n=1 Tax=Ooceraea biroi TaxID=2015173 RepID=A0A026W0Z8_OOCBI|nr:hypothetical protein X777_11614 [Ooceraea biroi]
MRITARNIGQLPRRKLGKLGSYAFHRAIDGLKKKRWIRPRVRLNPLARKTTLPL